MRGVFEEVNRLRKYLQVEAAVAQAQAEVGDIPKEAAEEIARHANTEAVKLDRCKEIEAEIGHDLMAVVKALTEACAGEGKRYVHFGLTSYDVEDTATALQFKEAIGLIRRELVEVQRALLDLAMRYRGRVMVGRTHGQHMAVITLGLKFAVWMRELARHLERLDEAARRVLVGKVMGAVGTGAALGKNALKVQEIALTRLGLNSADMVTQVVQRDVHAELIALLALIGSSLDKFALEVRNLQRTEIAELAEPFEEARQVGSSAMPAKRNPVACERVSSLAKLLRGLVVPAYENIPLWHERDLTNSANERFIFPMSFIILDEMLNGMAKVLRGLEVFPESMERNLQLTGGLVLSERVTNKLVEKGMGRQDAHELVRQCAMEALEKRIGFRKALLDRDDVSKRLTSSDLDECLDYSTYLGAAGRLIDEAVKRTRAEIGG